MASRERLHTEIKAEVGKQIPNDELQDKVEHPSFNA